jgi:hypothetical protein
MSEPPATNDPSMRRPPSKRDPRGDPTRCGHWGGRRKDGSLCVGLIVAGTKRCRMHPGKKLTKAKAEGAVVVELRRWGLDGHTELRDAGEVLLRLVTQSAARVELYSQLLAEAFDAAERMRRAHEAGALLVAAEESDVDGEAGELPAVQAARADLGRIFATGGVGALIGFKFDADRHGRIYAVEEGIRGLARLEADERDRCAGMAAKAIAAGLAERQVRLAERQGAAMYGLFSRVLESLGLDAEQLALVPALLEREIRALTGGGVIEGSAK